MDRSRVPSLQPLFNQIQCLGLRRVALETGDLRHVALSGGLEIRAFLNMKSIFLKNAPLLNLAPFNSIISLSSRCQIPHQMDGSRGPSLQPLFNQIRRVGLRRVAMGTGDLRHESVSRRRVDRSLSSVGKGVPDGLPSGLS